MNSLCTFQWTWVYHRGGGRTVGKDLFARRQGAGGVAMGPACDSPHGPDRGFAHSVRSAGPPTWGGGRGSTPEADLVHE